LQREDIVGALVERLRPEKTSVGHTQQLDYDAESPGRPLELRIDHGINGLFATRGDRIVGRGVLQNRAGRPNDDLVPAAQSPHERIRHPEFQRRVAIGNRKGAGPARNRGGDGRGW